MTLAESTRSLEQLDEDALICVRRPWGPGAECVVVAPDARLAVPADIVAAEFEYFLEVAVAREVLEILADRPATEGDRLRLLLHCAEHDAYPEWALRE